MGDTNSGQNGGVRKSNRRKSTQSLAILKVGGNFKSRKRSLPEDEEDEKTETAKQKVGPKNKKTKKSKVSKAKAAKVKGQAQRKSHGTPISYSVEEDTSIFVYIDENNLYDFLGGNHMWKVMAQQVGFQHRTWESLKSRFKKTLIKRMDRYKLDPKIIIKLQNRPREQSIRPLFRSYTMEEDTAILMYLKDAKCFDRVKSRDLWQQIELENVVPRTWQSSRSRFLYHIYPNFSKYKRLFKADDYAKLKHYLNELMPKSYRELVKPDSTDAELKYNPAIEEGSESDFVPSIESCFKRKAAQRKQDIRNVAKIKKLKLKKLRMKKARAQKKHSRDQSIIEESTSSRTNGYFPHRKPKAKTFSQADYFPINFVADITPLMTNGRLKKTPSRFNDFLSFDTTKLAKNSALKPEPDQLIEQPVPSRRKRKSEHRPRHLDVDGYFGQLKQVNNVEYPVVGVEGFENGGLEEVDDVNIETEIVCEPDLEEAGGEVSSVDIDQADNMVGEITVDCVSTPMF